MSTPQNDAFQIRAPKPIDSRYLKNEIIPWTSVAEVNTAIVSAYRYQGLTVLIGTREYWYIGGIADGNLVPKLATDTTLTLSSDGSYTFPVSAYVAAIIVIPAAGITFKAGSAFGLDDFIPAMNLAANVPAAMSVAIWRNAGQQIFFGGISGSSATIIIKTL